MKKASIWEQPVNILLIIAIAAVLLFVIYFLIGKWGAGNVKNITEALDITRYV